MFQLTAFLLIFLATQSLVVNSYRLPDTIHPERYKLEILTYLGEPNNFNFDGKVWIQTICQQPTQNITLHSRNLTINKATLKVNEITGKQPESLKLSKIDLVVDDDFLIISLEESLKTDHKYEIFIEFHGVLDEGLAGFYRSSYMEQRTKQKKWLAVTQFEPIKARKAFPCFDEPAMKATFDIKIGRKDGYTAISNMPLKTTEAIDGKNGWFWDHFEESVPMSTYLIAYIVSDFGYKQSKPSRHNNVTFRVWSRKEALNQVEFAREIGPRALEFFEDFFSIKYPLPKQDMVAIPDFSAGAMENWGLITYREVYLLFDPEISSTTSQYNVAEVISHELAHQWFGNLVTMKWWTDLWLNEGFATYMAGLAVHHIFPQWNSINEEAVKALLDVFQFDGLKTSHPVSVPIGHPDEIDEIFDTISYKKGSYLIRMMGLFLGQTTLRQGVSNYLKQHKYSNAEQDDLWESLTKQAHDNHVLPQNLTVKTIMDTWTLQTGYPVVTVKRNYDKNIAELKQERFFRDMTIRDGENCWWVPLSYTTRIEKNFNDSQPKAWLSCPSKQQIIDDLPDQDNWILFNINLGGIYKINYDEANWKLLINALKQDNYDNIPTLNRVQLIDDISDLAWTGQLKYNLFFDLIQYLRNENEYLPWKAALGNINALNRQLKRTPFYGDFKMYMKQILTPIYQKVGGLCAQQSNTNNLDAIKHQILILHWSCRFDVADCIQTSRDLITEWQQFPQADNPVPKDLRNVVYCTAIRHGDENVWNFIWQQYKKSNVATEKSSILSALGCTKELWLLNRYLDWSIQNNSSIRRQDLSTVFSSVVGNDVGYYVAKDFFYHNIAKIHKYLGSASRRLSRFLAGLANQMTTEHEYLELQKLVTEQSSYFKEIKKGVEQSLENVQLNAQWRNHHLGHLSGLLRNYLKDDADF